MCWAVQENTKWNHCCQIWGCAHWIVFRAGWLNSLRFQEMLMSVWIKTQMREFFLWHKIVLPNFSLDTLASSRHMKARTLPSGINSLVPSRNLFLEAWHFNICNSNKCSVFCLSANRSSRDRQAAAGSLLLWVLLASFISLSLYHP